MNSFYAVTGLINAIIPPALGIFVYAKNRIALSNKAFLFLTLSASLWGFGYSLWQLSDNAIDALLWSRILMAGAIFIPITFYQFVAAFLEIHTQKIHKTLIILGYAAAWLFGVFSITSLFVQSVSQKLSFQFWPNPGPVFHFFLGYYFLYILYASILLFTKFKETSGIQKQQILYILIGTVIGFTGGSTNFFLWYDIPIAPLGNMIAVAFIVFVAYAILRHHLFDIKVITAELFSALLLFVLFVNLLHYDTPARLALDILIFLATAVFSTFLIRSVLWEVKTRQEMEALAQELAEANEELKKLDKAKSEFVSIASHQLRTPLTAIKGYISMLLEGTYGAIAQTQQKPAQSVYDSNERLIKLVNDLLNVSRINAGRIELKLEQKDLSRIMENVVEELSVKTRGNGAKLVYHKPKKPLPPMLVDEEKIRNVFLNVLDNALRYTPSGTVTAAISRVPSQNLARVEITDTGEGMSKDEIDHLFSSFSRGVAGSRLWTEGAGLGLYIAKKFVDLHKGTISAHSEGKGKGSVFVIELPMQ